MREHPVTISSELILDYIEMITYEDGVVEESTGGVYSRQLMNFMDFLDGRPITRENVLAYKRNLMKRNLNPATINGHISAVNGFLKFLGMGDLCMKLLKITRKTFVPEERKLSKKEYFKLVDTAYSTGKERLALLLQVLAGTGMRASEVKNITVEAVTSRSLTIYSKGKGRDILIVAKLRKKLLDYAKKHGIQSGPIICTSTGRALGRKQIWAEMKALCEKAGVSPEKVFPHNLRHLFATVHYKTHHDLELLSRLLGHSSISTTRIYIDTTQKQAEKSVEQLDLIS